MTGHRRKRSAQIETETVEDALLAMAATMQGFSVNDPVGPEALHIRQAIVDARAVECQQVDTAEERVRRQDQMNAITERSNRELWAVVRRDLPGELVRIEAEKEELVDVEMTDQTSDGIRSLKPVVRTTVDLAEYKRLGEQEELDMIVFTQSLQKEVRAARPKSTVSTYESKQKKFMVYSHCEVY